MKESTLFAALTLAAMLFTGCASQQAQTNTTPSSSQQQMSANDQITQNSSVNQQTIQSDSLISEDKAKELALSQVPGATENDIREFKADLDDGKLEYEGKIYYDGMKFEFEIDKYSGAFHKWESEPIYD